ncbi:cell division protein ZapA [Saccharospirillum salsuginis]|uniref:Cell division protein ZapA n=1 Tax=Saccharospirillum salsuginis TaxID=418750 RepID=A0A918KTW2_9GAMM|nr:cell division protein ZapA [Saccharospirillum salsuginis]GGX75925.1 cell division protein ZapA [Saccharospirillum salsuginis]
MNEHKTLTVTILEREYRVACPEGQEPKLEEAARSLDKKMKEIRSTGKVFGIERIAVMAALNLTRELIDREPVVTQDLDALARLESKIDAAMPEQIDIPMELDPDEDAGRA